MMFPLREHKSLLVIIENELIPPQLFEKYIFP